MKYKSRAEKEEVIEYLQMANDTMDFLRSIGEKPKMNKNIKKILSKMRVSSSASKNCQIDCIASISTIKNLVKKIIK